MKTIISLIICMMLIPGIFSYVGASSRLTRKLTYICNAEKKLISREINGATYLSRKSFKVSTNSRKVEFKNIKGEKWLIWLTELNKPDSESQVLRIKSLSAGRGNYYQVFSKPGDPYLGLKLDRKLSINCIRKM